jgi:membrane-associated phospholipid phosphatase
MRVSGLYCFALVFVGAWPQIGALDTSLESVDNPFKKTQSRNVFVRAGNGIKTLLWDSGNTIVRVHCNLISWETFSLAVSAFPFFIAARIVDNKLQNHFYDPSNHRNCSQFPSWLKPVVEKGIGVPMAILMSYALFCYGEDDRRMGRIFATIMPFVIFGKNILKSIEFDCSLRPWNQHFDHKKRACGGFPSGHMAEAVYMAAFFGMQYGPSHAVPLGVFATVLGVTFINCNRHYLSQIVAGGIWGAMFAVASYKLMEKEHAKRNLSVAVGMNDNGAPAVGLNYSF